MASYQEIDSRLRAVEDRLMFVMTHMRMKAAVTSGVLDQNGQPIIDKVFDGSMLELYHLSNQLPTVNEHDVKPDQAPVAPAV